MSSIVYLLLLCLSLDACNARHLGVDIDKQTSEGFHLFGKDVEKEKHQETLIPSSVSPSFSEGLRTREKLIGENDETEIHDGWGVSNNRNHKETKAPRPWKEIEDTKENEMTASPSQEVLQEATKIEEWKKLARRKMLGSTTQDAEETVESKEENDAAVEEDIVVVMDYAQPHRKPPIHNYRGP